MTTFFYARGLKSGATIQIIPTGFGDLLGATNGEREAVSEAMIIRDKAYTYMKQAVDEIRECGKFVFWRNPDRLKGYVSDFWKSKK